MFIAASSRGWVKKTSLSTLKIMGNLVGMLLVRSFERTEHIRDAMVSRGYNGGLKILDEFALCSKDFFKASLIGAAILALYLPGWVL